MTKNYPNNENQNNEISKLEINNVKEERKIDIDELSKNHDNESKSRIIKGKVGLLIVTIAIAMSTFHLFTAVIPMVSAKHRALHLLFTLVLVFLLFPGRKKSNKNKPTIFDYLFATVSAISVGYLFVMFDTIANRGMSSTTLDLIMGAITMIVILEATRRSIGIELVILSLIFLGYAYLGPYLPGDLAHRGHNITTLIEHMYIGSEGIFGIALGTSATYIFLFILFGAFLNGSGLSSFFTNGAMAVAGHRVGGPAKVSILASGGLGMINGSATANVATTGVFTIPLMKKVGYSKRFSGGVEATASTGGQFTPPIMGAAAFIMAEMLGIPYTSVLIAAIIPAFLYFLSIWIMVHYEGKKTGLRGIPKEQLPAFKPILKERGHLVLPVILLMVLLFMDYTPVYAAFFAIVATYLVSFLRKSTRMDFKTVLKTLEEGAKAGLTVGVATAVVGYIIGVVSLTGVGLKLANVILVLANEQLFLTLLLTMVTAIILGMGLPTAACYIVGATVAAPSLIQLGVEPIVAHFFVLYFACLSAITPPVALASYAGAGIAGESPSKVGWTGFRLGIAGFIVPFAFVYSPELLIQTNDYLASGLALISAIIGVLALGTSVVGFFLVKNFIIESVMLFGAALFLIQAGIMTDSIGIVLLLLVILNQLKRKKRLEIAIDNRKEVI